MHRYEHCGPRYKRIRLLTVMISTELDQLHNAVIKVMEPHKGTGNKAKCEAMKRWLQDESIDSPSKFYGWVDKDKADNEWWDIMKGVEGWNQGGRPVRLIWSQIKEIWRATKTLVEERSDKELTKEELEAPLDKTTNLSLDSAWDQRYGRGYFRISPYLHPGYGLLGKVYREFRRTQPTVIRVSKVLSLFMLNKPDIDSEDKEVGEGLFYRVKTSGEVRIRNVPDYYEGLRILGNCYAKCGNYEVAGQDGKKVIFAPFDVNLDYADMALRSAFLTNKTPQQRLAWLTEQDHLTRGAMCSLILQGWSQGEALKQAIKEHAIEWKISTMRTEQQLVDERDTRFSIWPGAKRPPKGKGKGDKGKGRRTGGVYQESKGASKGKGDRNKVRKDKFAKVTPPHCTHYFGKPICKGFNDGRCTAKGEWDCPKRQQHVCDVRLPNGQACGSKEHNRYGHRY